MRKNIKNNMITRILAIGLATAVFATSAPASVFADEEETVTVEASESSSDSSSESSDSSSESSDSASCESEAPAVEAVAETAPEAAPEVSPEVAPEAAPEAAPVAEEGTVVAEVLIIDNNLVPAQEEPAVEGEQEATPEQDAPAIDPNTKEGVLALKADAEEKVEKADKSIDNLNEKTGSVNEAESKTDGEADSAVANAEIANTSPSKKEAYQAKADAINDITGAEADLENVNAAYEAAVEAKEQAEADVKAAEEAHAKAVDALNQLKNTAQQNLTAAQAAYNDAASRANALQNQISVLTTKKEEIEKIEVQYYAMMDYYYRNFIYNNKPETAVLNKEDGTLNLVASLKNAQDTLGADYINAIADDPEKKGPGYDKEYGKGNKKYEDRLFELGRGLMYDLVEYMLKNNENVDATTISIGKEFDGIVDKNHQKTKPAEYVKTVDGKEVITEGSQLWGNVDGQAGRRNHIMVTYKDKKGNDYTQYFNYVFKNTSNKNYDKELDISNGPIYLALVTYNETTKKWDDKVTRYGDDNNLDNYGALTEKIAAYEGEIKELEQKKNSAEAAASAAAARVSQYSQELRELNNIKIDDSRIKELKEKLADAVTDLKEAEEAKEALEVKVEEARKIVDAIDLSRFKTEDDSDYEEEYSSDPIVPIYPIPSISDIPAIIPTIPTTLPTVIASFPRSGVLGVRVEASNDNVVSDVTKKDAAPIKEIDLGSKTVASNNGKKIVKLENNEVPLAAMPGVEEGLNMNWLWLLLVAAAVIIVVTSYEKHKKNVAANKVNSSNK